MTEHPDIQNGQVTCFAKIQTILQKEKTEFSWKVPEQSKLASRQGKCCADMSIHSLLCRSRHKCLREAPYLPTPFLELDQYCRHLVQRNSTAFVILVHRIFLEAQELPPQLSSFRQLCHSKLMCSHAPEYRFWS